MKIRNTERRETIVLQMTPMIDIVFQLLVFFVFTFKIVLPEGDFNIRMPSATASPSSEAPETPLLKVKLQANDEGELVRVQLGDLFLDGDAPFHQLHAQIRELVSDDAGPGSTDQEVEIEADYGLKYRYAMTAITAITGYLDSDGNKHKLVERVRFAPLAED
ncbi:MAG: biopolymer transporter ExbD [Pirellulales bacterium]|nr:biopolymer transporter ExbD [Pirellulales bacterium]